MDGCLNIAEEDSRRTPLDLPRDADRSRLAEELAQFILKVASLSETESESLPITLAIHMLQALPAQRPSATEVLWHSGLAPPLLGANTPVPRQPMYPVAPQMKEGWVQPQTVGV